MVGDQEHGEDVYGKGFKIHSFRDLGNILVEQFWADFAAVQVATSTRHRYCRTSFAPGNLTACRARHHGTLGRDSELEGLGLRGHHAHQGQAASGGLPAEGGARNDHAVGPTRHPLRFGFPGISHSSS